MEHNLDLDKRVRTTLRGITEELPADFEGRAAALQTIRSVMHEEICRALSARFNQHLRTAPQEDLEAKRVLCSWANHELRQLGLAVRCPKTGMAAILLASPNRAGDTEGRFRLAVRDEAGEARSTYSGRALPELEFMEHSIRREALAIKYRRGR